MPSYFTIPRNYVNCDKQNTRLFIPLGALMVLATPVIAQQPQYVPPPPPTKNSTIEVRLRYLIPPDINFQGLGSIPFRDSYTSENDILQGTERSIAYDDGFLAQDYIEATLIEGSDGTQRIPSPNGDATANFAYIDEAQLDPNDPTALIFHRYASAVDPDQELEGSASGSLGWELSYTKYLNRSRNLGMQVGFSFNGFDSRFNDSISADLYVQQFKHNMADGAEVPELPEPVENSDGSTSQAPYIGDVVREDADSGDLLEWLASEESEELILDGATVDSKADLRSSIYNFRAGPTYNLSLGNRFAFQMGAGVTAIYYAGQFSAYEMLEIPDSGETRSRSLTTTDANEWQVGGYVDASAHYQFNPWVSLFSGMQVQSGSTYEQENEDRHANVDFSSQVYIHAGVGIRF